MAIDLFSYLYATTVAAGGVFGYVKSGNIHKPIKSLYLSIVTMFCECVCVCV